MKINALAVFCGSKIGNNPVYAEHAAALGRFLAANNITLVYGGGNVGIMGILADAVLAGGGKVIGVIPKILLEWERQHQSVTQLIITDDMHIRKKKMYELCDAALALPGGFGTLDEFFEMITWNQLSIHDKNIFLLNSEGYFSYLLKHLEKMETEGFLYEKITDRITILDEPQLLENFLS